MLKIGILAIQGDIRFHNNILYEVFKDLKIDGEVIKIKKKEDLENIDGLIIPGGESTVIGSLSQKVGLFKILHQKITNGLPVLGTCAGLIFLAKNIYDKRVGKIDQPVLGILDIDVQRNAYGTQKESFETKIKLNFLGEEPYNCIFIRAPAIKSVRNGEILATFNDDIIVVKQDKIIGVTFHPELNKEDLRFFKFFINLIINN